MERTKKYRIWFQAASELIKEERKYDQGHFLFLSWDTLIALLPKVWNDNKFFYVFFTLLVFIITLM